MNNNPKNLSCCKRKIKPVVSTEWLESNLDQDDVIVLDVRTTYEYDEGHIKGSINIPFEVPRSEWVIVKNNLLLELPEKEKLFNTVGSCGINKNSRVVVVTSLPTPPDPPFSIANAAFVATILIYLGIDNTAVLDGGIAKWIAEDKEITIRTHEVEVLKYSNDVKDDIFVSLEYVKENISNEKVIIIDGRDADVYFGVTLEPFADKAGHISGARSLPTPWLWNKDGTYKSAEDIQKMFTGVVGDYQLENKEIICYCGAGGYAYTWWYIITQVLGYDNVKIYSGSAQEWVKDNNLVKYKWSI